VFPVPGRGTGWLSDCAPARRTTWPVKENAGAGASADAAAPWRGPRMASSSSAAIRSVVASSFCHVVSAEARSAGTCVIGCWGMSAR
jgi:hypothetical protein